MSLILCLFSGFGSHRRGNMLLMLSCNVPLLLSQLKTELETYSFNILLGHVNFFLKIIYIFKDGIK